MKRIAIIGGGPAGLFFFKRLTSEEGELCSVDIFEASPQIGKGFPYSHNGSCTEHITNVSGNEIPELRQGLLEWIKTLPEKELDKYGVEKATFNDYKTLPRLLFGKYLEHQFELLVTGAIKKGHHVTIRLNTKVTDICDLPENNEVRVEAGDQHYLFSEVIISTGHYWPKKHEGLVDGYFDSPYPPSKLEADANYPIAIRGSSLTAIDAVRTLARHHGKFQLQPGGQLTYTAHSNAENFRIVLHSINGLLPGIRFHLDDPRLSGKSSLSQAALECHMQENDGFLSLDFIFEQDFKKPLIEKNPALYQFVENLSLEEFVNNMMQRREALDPFQLFKREYKEAAASIRNEQSVYWKEMLAVLSFALNYPAKHLSAEDMIRLKKILMPLISIIIAFVPQSSCEELLALYEAGKLDIVSVTADSYVKPQKTQGAVYVHLDDKGNRIETPYNMFIDAIGQPHLELKDFPFRSMVINGTVSPALLAFRSDDEGLKFALANPALADWKADRYFMRVPGLAINDHFQVIDRKDQPSQRIFLLSVPFIGGYNPDYSGLDFCEEASKKVMDAINGKNVRNQQPAK